MLSRRLVGAVGLIVGVLYLVGCRTAVDSGPLPGVDVQHYDVHLHLDRSTTHIEAQATLTVHLSDTTDALRLALDGLDVDTVRVDGILVTAAHRRGVLTVPGPLPPGLHRVYVRYAGTPDSGLYSREVADQPVRFTDSWPVRGRGWFPGVHHPSDPATWRLTLDVPPGRDVLATGTLQHSDTLSSTVRTVWTLDQPAPTYALAFAVGNFEASFSTAPDGVPVALYSVSSTPALAASLPAVERALGALADLLGPYPYASYRAAQVPIHYAGMENATLAFVDPTLRGAAQTRVLVHELAHQWFGNDVVLADWHDLWLSEGMATFLATFVMEHTDSETARHRWVELARLTPRRRRSLVPLVRHEVDNPTSHLTWVVYEKGACVLFLLRKTLGEAAFKAVLRQVRIQYADQPLSTEAFQRVAEDIAERELDTWFDVWVYDRAVPVLRTRWDQRQRTMRWDIEDDGGTLDGVSFLLRIQQGGDVYDVPVEQGKVVLPGDRPPEVLPVGVMLDVQ